MRRLALLAVSASLLAAAPAQARPGDLDRSFAGHGRVAFKVWGSGGGTTGMALVGGLRPLLSVDAYRGVNETPALLQLTAAGRLESRTPVIDAVPLAPLLADGYSLTYVGPAQYRLQRIGSSQSVTITLPQPRPLTVIAFGVDGAGRLVIAGDFDPGNNNYGNDDRAYLARYLPTGAIDTGFGTDGRVQIDKRAYVYKLIVKRDGRVFVVDPARWITALDATGRPLKGFRQGRVPRPHHSTFRVEAFTAGRRGTFWLAGTGPRAWIAHIRADGHLDKRFGTDGFLWRPNAFLYRSFLALALDRRGRLIVGGVDEQPHRDIYALASVVIRLTPGGRFDRTFAKRGMKEFQLGRPPGTSQSGSGVSEIAIDRHGRIVVAGESFDDDFAIREDVGSPYPAIARLLG